MTGTLTFLIVPCGKLIPDTVNTSDLGRTELVRRKKLFLKREIHACATRNAFLDWVTSGRSYLYYQITSRAILTCTIKKVICSKILKNTP